jgi:hypothetical protein
MSDNIATMALIVRGNIGTIRGWVKELPPDLEIIHVSHHNEGLVILSNDELAQMRHGFTDQTTWGLRRKVGRALTAQIKNGTREELPSTTHNETEGTKDQEEVKP